MPVSAVNHCASYRSARTTRWPQPLLAELAVEYATRYDGTVERVGAWLRGYPADEFAPPRGGMLVGLLDGVPVTGGAFRRFDDDTAELKRIWTDSAAPPSRARPRAARGLETDDRRAAGTRAST